jgi:hypothetical protein
MNTAQGTARRDPSARMRFFLKVDLDADGCLVWTASLTDTGYGQFSLDGGVMLAHRASWVLHWGPIPPGKFVCHACDKRRCVHPMHLFLGTAADNVRDMVLKGRHGSKTCPSSSPRGDAHYSRLAPELVLRGKRHSMFGKISAFRGEKSPLAKLTWSQVEEIRTRYAGGERQADLAARFDTDQTNISLIVKGKTWRPEGGR